MKTTYTINWNVKTTATEKALSLRRRLARGTLKSPRELEHKRVSEQHSEGPVM